MTRKDYVLIADALRQSRPYPDNLTNAGRALNAQWLLTREKLADRLAAVSANFDRDRFIRATEA